MLAMDIKTYRKANKLTLDQFGVLVGVTGATVQRWETGKVNMPLSKAHEIQLVTRGIITLDDLAGAFVPAQPSEAA